MGAAILGALWGAGHPEPASAQSATPGGAQQVFRDWTFQCAAAGACEIVQEVRRRAGEDRLLAASVSRNANGATTLALATPLGVALPPGAELFLDVSPTASATLAFAVCQQDGCLARTPLEGALLSAFQTGTAIRVRLRTPEGRAVEFPISLRGFSEAHRRLSGGAGN